MLKLMRACCMGALLLLAQQARAAIADDAVGMVLDVRGQGEQVRKAGSARLQLLDYVKAGALIKLEAGATLSLSHYGARLIYQLTGPAQAQVEAGGLKVLKGAPAQTKSLAEKVVSAALNPNMGPAAFKMRGAPPEVALVAPANRGVQLSLRPVFQWDADQGASYEVALVEEPGRALLSAKVDATSWQLPEGMRLDYGKTYRWSVSYVAPADGVVRSARAVFSTASQADAENLLSMRPDGGAGVDEWVLYASLLQDRRMLDDAREAWRLIMARRPDLNRAQSLSR